MDFTPHDLIPTQKSLLLRLRDWNDQTGWKAFFDTYWRLIYAVARHAGLSDAEAQDVVQETVIAVAKQMPEFKYDPAIGSFKGWLLQLTRWRIQDQLRKKQYQKDGRRLQKEERLGTSLLEAQPDPASLNWEHKWDEEWQKNLLETALERVKARTKSQTYQVFYFHVCKRMPARVVADRLGVKLAHVYYAKLIVSRSLQREIQKLERQVL